jgi:hypothetical protein
LIDLTDNWKNELCFRAILIPKTCALNRVWQWAGELRIYIPCLVKMRLMLDWVPRKKCTVL